MNISIRQPLGYSHIGRKDNQEDNVYPLFENANVNQRVFILCDGVGGQDYGEVASRTVCDTVGDYLEQRYKTCGDVDTDDINRAIEEAYDALNEKDKDKKSTMATTFTCVCTTKSGVIVAHMGDSRIYQIRPLRGIMYQSADHSLVNALLASGEITPEEAKSYPKRNVITRAIQPTTDKRFCAEIHLLSDIKAGDYFFLCCDGVLEQLTNERLVEILSSEHSDEEKLALLEAESADKTKDNYTAYLIPINEVDGDTSATNEEEIATVAVEHSGRLSPQSKIAPQSKPRCKLSRQKRLQIIKVLSVFAVLVIVGIVSFLVRNTKKETNKQEIDANKIKSVLNHGIKRYDAKSGQIAVMDVKTGQILAAVGDGLATPHYSALVKSAILLAALETRRVRLNDTVDTGNGVLKVNGIKLKDHNWNRGGYGKITVMQGLACLSNIAIYKTLQQTWGKDTQAFLKALDETGYSKACSVAGYGELSKADASEYGLYADITPLQTLIFFNDIAKNEMCTESTDSLTFALRHCVTDGLSRKANSDKVAIAGLAGSMQEDDGSYWLEFCGFFPAENPQYTVIVTLRKDGRPASGSRMAAPIFKEIAELLTSNK